MRVYHGSRQARQNEQNERSHERCNGHQPVQLVCDPGTWLLNQMVSSPFVKSNTGLVVAEFLTDMLPLRHAENKRYRCIISLVQIPDT